MPLVPTALLLGLGRGDLLQSDNTAWEASSELVGITTDDWGEDLNSWKEAVRGGSDRRELGVICSNTLDGMHLQIDSLLRTKLRDQDFWVGRTNNVLAGEPVYLLSRWVVNDIACMNGGVDVFFIWVCFVWCCIRVELALDLEGQDDGVVVEASAVRDSVFLITFLKPLQLVEETVFAAGQWNQTESVGENFVLDYGGVVVDEDVLDGQGWDLSDENATECICDGGINADKREGGIESPIVVELDFKLVAELVEVPSVVFTRVVAWEVGGGHIVDGLKVNADNLGKWLVLKFFEIGA